RRTRWASILEESKELTVHLLLSAGQSKGSRFLGGHLDHIVARVEACDYHGADRIRYCLIEHECIIAVADRYGVAHSHIDGVGPVANRNMALASRIDRVVAITDGDGAIFAKDRDRIIAVA